MAQTRYIEGRGRYALSEMVGRGGFATVWRARCLGGLRGIREVAVKIIPVYSVAERSRAMREGQIAEGLKHRNVVETFEVIPGDLEVYLVTEFVQGMPLDEAANGYGIEEITDALSQILEALVYAHGQGIIHRDIKPQNALVDARGTLKLTDFGVAYRAGDTRLTRVGYAVGTPGYIAPEILDGADPSALTDIYAVGATARTLLARQPYEAPPRLREFVDRATSPNPAHRPQSAWAALRLLTDRRAPTRTQRELAPEQEKYLQKTPGRLSEHALRLVNGLAAGWLGFLLGSQLLNLGGAEAAGISAGLGVAGYLLPRLAALGVVVALAVALLRNGIGLGFAALVPVLGGAWIFAGGALSGGVSRLPLGPVLAVPLELVGSGTGLPGLGTGLPLLLGGLMRPLGAVLSAAAGALVLIGYELTGGDGVVPFLGYIGKFSPSLGPAGLVAEVQDLITQVPQIPLLAALWATMAGVISLAEWAGRPFIGLVVAVGGGAVGYALAVSTSSPHSLTQAMTSLGLAAIIYAVLRYLGSRARG
jgi:eukaryotic-like serine/threonine-protein kinase